MAYYDNYSSMQQRPRSGTSVVYTLILINALIFILGSFTVHISGERVKLENLFLEYGALMPLKGFGGLVFHPWQYLTCMFLHGGIGHIFMNMLGLWMFGTEIERVWGSKRFLFFYIACGLGGGIVHSIVTYFYGGAGPTIGASGAVMGVLAAYGMMFPNRTLLLYFFFPMRAKYAVLVFAALDLYLGFRGTDNIAHFAHLGGALTGFILIKIGGVMTLGGIFDRFSRTDRQIGRSGPTVVDVKYREIPTTPRQPQPLDLGSDQERIHEILDKISQSGYQSLTEEERELLMEASRKLRRED